MLQQVRDDCTTQLAAPTGDNYLLWQRQILRHSKLDEGSQPPMARGPLGRLLGRDVLDVGRDEPLVPERVYELTSAIAVELILDLALLTSRPP